MTFWRKIDVKRPSKIHCRCKQKNCQLNLLKFWYHLARKPQIVLTIQGKKAIQPQRDRPQCAPGVFDLDQKVQSRYLFF